MYFGRFPTGRAIRCNAFLPQAQHKKPFPLLSLTQRQMHGKYVNFFLKRPSSITTEFLNEKNLLSSLRF
jgi:hypothetical protein